MALIQTHTFTKPTNGVAAGTYQWFNNRREAEAAAAEGTVVLQTSPSGPRGYAGIFRARVA